MNERGVRQESAIDYFRRMHAARKAPKAKSKTRLALIAAERGISDKELQQFRGSRRNSKMFNYQAFAKKYQISLDWLLDGDLKGLLETMRGCPSRPQKPVLTSDELHRAQLQEFRDALGKLDERMLPLLLEQIRHLAASQA